MKRLIFLLFMLPLFVSAQQTFWTTSPSGWTALSSPAFRFKANTPDSTNNLLIFNPLTGKYNQLYTATQENLRFLQKIDTGRFIQNQNRIDQIANARLEGTITINNRTFSDLQQTKIIGGIVTTAMLNPFDSTNIASVTLRQNQILIKDGSTEVFGLNGAASGNHVTSGAVITTFDDTVRTNRVPVNDLDIANKKYVDANIDSATTIRDVTNGISFIGSPKTIGLGGTIDSNTSLALTPGTSLGFTDAFFGKSSLTYSIDNFGDGIFNFSAGSQIVNHKSQLLLGLNNSSVYGFSLLGTKNNYSTKTGFLYDGTKIKVFGDTYGMEYQGDYSTTLLAASHGIPDIPIVKTLIHGIGDTAFIKISSGIIHLSDSTVFATYSGAARVVALRDTLIGSGNIFIKLPKGSNAANGGTMYVSNKTDSLWYRQFNASVRINVKWFGAKGDGSTDDTRAVKSMAYFNNASPYKRNYIPKGTYVVKKPVAFPANTDLMGDGRESIIDGSTADSVSFPVPVDQIRASLITIAGTAPTQIATTNVKPLFGDTTLSLAASATISQNDYLMLSDTASYSYSRFRAGYKQGEIVRASRSSTGSTTSLQGRIIGHLYKNNPIVYKMGYASAKISGLTIIAPSPGRSEITALRLDYITDGKIEDVHARGSNYAVMSINNCANIDLDKVFINKNTVDITGTSYGLVIGYSQDIHVTNSEMYAVRHAMSSGQGGLIGIVNRRINASKSIFSSTSGVGAYEHHGDTEFSVVTESQINGSLTMAGRKNKAKGNIILQGETGNGTAINFIEILQPAFDIEDNDVYSYKPVASRGMWLSITTTDSTEYTGSINIFHNRFYYDNKYASSAANNGLYFQHAGTATDGNKITYNITNNRLMSTDSTNSVIGINTSATTSVRFPLGIISNNYLERVDMEAKFTKNVVVSGNTISLSKFSGISAVSNISTTIKGNSLNATNVVSTGSSTTNAAIYINAAGKANVGGNDVYAGANTTYGLSVNVADTLNISPSNMVKTNTRNYNFVSVGFFQFDVLSHNLAPNSNIAAKVGAIYIQDGGTLGNVLWVKTSGATNTGWDQVTTSANTATLANKILTSPTLTTPALGVSTATSVNKVAITAPATSATLTIANGKTLTANNSITITGTDATTMTFPTTSATIARTDAANTFTGVQTMTSPALTTPKLTGYTVATLPAGTVGMIAYVTDALTPTFGNTLVGGGAVVAKAFYNGTNWINE